MSSKNPAGLPVPLARRGDRHRAVADRDAARPDQRNKLPKPYAAAEPARAAGERERGGEARTSLTRFISISSADASGGPTRASGAFGAIAR